MPRPHRSTQLSELSDEQVWCHAYGHNWDDPPCVDTELRIGKVVQQRQDHRCDNGCGCTKGHYVHPPSGRRWGWKRSASDWYGIDGGYTRDDFVAEWFRRTAAGGAKPVPAGYVRKRSPKRPLSS